MYHPQSSTKENPERVVGFSDRRLRIVSEYATIRQESAAPSKGAGGSLDKW